MLSAALLLALGTLPAPWDELPSGPSPVARAAPTEADTEEAVADLARTAAQFDQQRRELAADRAKLRAVLEARAAEPRSNEPTPAPTPAAKRARGAKGPEVIILTGPARRPGTTPVAEGAPAADPLVDARVRALAEKEAQLQEREAAVGQREAALQAELTRQQEEQQTQAKTQAAKRKAVEKQAEQLDSLYQSVADGLGSR